LMSLVIAYSGGYPEEPQAGRLPVELEDQYQLENDDTPKKRNNGARK
jgi:hypothetical protein